MRTPEEVTFESILFGGVLTALALGVALVVFFVVYQRKLLAQQMRLQQIESAYQKELLAASIRAQEAERERIGHDLHDEIGSALAAVKLLVNQIAAGASDAESRARAAGEMLGQTVHEVRHVAHNLYPAVLTKFGLPDALHHLVAVLAEASQTEFELDVDDVDLLPPDQALAVYRMAQELAHNALKHARATAVRIGLKQVAGQLRLGVADNGRGFDYAAAREGAGLGLKSVEARASLLQADLRVHSAPGAGTRVEIGWLLNPT